MIKLTYRLTFVKRKCKLFDLEKFFGDVPTLEGNFELYIDESNESDILDLLEKYEKKFKRALIQINSGIYNNDIYGKEEVSNKAKNVTAIKFKTKDNERIYCKEFFLENKKIVMIVFRKKKTQKVNKEFKNLLETIGGYEYDFG